MALVFNDRVLETSVSTGTGAFTLAAAITGYQRFADACSTNDTCYYFIQAVDGNGNPSGAWETGLGTYSSANTLTRTTVHQSSNADAAVNFAAGTKYVAITPTAAYLNTLHRQNAPTTQTGSSYTAVLGDAGGYIQFTNAGATAFTIPPNATVAFPIGTVITFEQNGAGVVTLTTAGTTVFNSRGNLVATGGQYAVVQIKKVATNTWTVIGDVA
jgi:hypothetical protein